jgi:hypothetical protein
MGGINLTKLIAFDTSTRKTGYSIFLNGEYHASGLVDCSEDKIMRSRALEMIKQIYKVIEFENPDIIITETTVVTRNAEAQRYLTYILGAIIGKCVEKSIAYDSLRPAEWRSKVRNKDEQLPRKRDELKEWGKEKVFELYGKEVESDDIADSILIGRAYCNIAINL